MATTAFLRSVARTSRVAGGPSKLARRGFASTLAKGAQTSERAETPRTAHDYHTVEDLQGLHASDILPEPGTEKDAKMRHFTGVFSFG